MTLTKEDYDILADNLPTIEMIVKNASASNISIDFRDTIVRMGKRYNMIGCDSCNRELYLCICRLYDKYLDFKNNLTTNGSKKRKKKDGN